MNQVPQPDGVKPNQARNSDIDTTMAPWHFVPACSTAVMPTAFMAALAAWPAAFTTSMGLKPAATAAAAAASVIRHIRKTMEEKKYGRI